MNGAAEVADFARAQLEPVLGKSGGILYSAAATIRPYPVYLLGLNPGGSPERVMNTVRASIDALQSKTTNSYLDESWAGSPVGEGRLQRRVRWLLEALGHEPRDVPASNLIFVRSRDAKGIDFERIANTCWPVHEKILKIVRPRLVLVFGNSGISPYSFLFRKYGATVEQTQPSGHGSWLCRSFEVPGHFRVAGLPHLSRYKVIGHEHVVKWLKELAL